MTDQKVTDLTPATTPLDGTELLYVVQSGTDAQVAASDLPISDSVQTALDGKANTSHTHAIADVTGLQTELDLFDAELLTSNDFLMEGWEIIWHTAGSGASTLTTVGGAALTATGTATAAAFTTTNRFQRTRRINYLVTVASTSAVAGFRYNSANTVLRGNQSWLGGFLLDHIFGVSTGTSNATRRMFSGLRGSSAAPTDVNPSTLTNIIGVGYDNGDTNLSIMHNDGSGTATKVDLGSNFPKPSADNTNFYRLKVWCDPNTSEVYYWIKNLDTDNTASGTLSTDLPAATQYLTLHSYTSVGGTSEVTGMSFFRGRIRSMNQ